MNLWISPHNDDETLFGAFTLMREKPLVLIVTDSYIQALRGDGITADQRIRETLEAMKILDCPVCFGGIPDSQITEEELFALFASFENFNRVYVPAVYGNGNPHHDLIGKVAIEHFGSKVIPYATYTKDNLYMTGNTEIKPTDEEMGMKIRALQCYHSQLSLPSTRPHFEAVMGKSEWLN